MIYGRSDFEPPAPDKHPDTFFLLVDPQLQQGDRWSLIRGFVETLSYEDEDTSTIYPNPKVYRRFKNTFLSFLENGDYENNTHHKVLSKLEKSNASIVRISWTARSPGNASYCNDRPTYKYDMVLDLVPVMSSMEVFSYGIETLLDESTNGAPEVVKKIKAIYKKQNSECKELDMSYDGNKGEILILKPGFMGVGVDLRNLMRRVFNTSYRL